MRESNAMQHIYGSIEAGTNHEGLLNTLGEGLGAASGSASATYMYIYAMIDIRQSETELQVHDWLPG